MDVHVNGDREEYERKKQDLEQQSKEALLELSEEGLHFSKVQSCIRRIRSIIFKITSNDKYKNKKLTPSQKKCLKKTEGIKKQMDLLMEEYRVHVWDKVKDIMLHTDSMEISKHPLKIPLKMMLATLKDNMKINKEFWPILKNIREPLHLLDHYKQNNIGKEFHTFFERFMGKKYQVNRSIIEKNDSAWIYGLLDLFVRDIFVLCENWEKTSYKELKKETKKENKKTKQKRKDKKEAHTKRINAHIRENTDFGKNIAEIEKLKKEGKRVFIVIPHPSYLWAVMPRYAMMKLWFKSIAGNWNFICGPRVLSSWFIAWWVKTIWNLWMTLPSRNTTPIKTEGLERELIPQTLKTGKIISWDIDKVKWAVWEKITYNKTKNEVFVVAPEWSRSNEMPDGSIELKYCSPDLFGVFIKPGDYVVAFSQTGSEKILPKGRKMPWFWSIWVSLWKPWEVTEEMTKNGWKEGAMDTVMWEVCELPSLTNIVCKPKIKEEPLKNTSGPAEPSSCEEVPKKNHEI